MSAKQHMHTVKTTEDARLIADLARVIWTEHYTPIIGSGQVEYMLENFQSPQRILQDVTQQGYTYIWLEQDGKPAAYMAYRFDFGDEACFLSKLYVSKSCRGRGLARILVDHLVQCCQNNQLKMIWLTVNKNNSQSIEAYKKMMFHKTRSIITDIGGGYVMDDAVMQRDL
ncbi:MAG: GNAT family N-acetyltransferase [Bacillota bacterium]|nr:GNAT family N-acetyltransferase [Bacillota bacterium]